jgi:DNA repair exonuclease SbcCD ATPase subunit
MNHKETNIEVNFPSVLIVGKSNKNDRISNGVGKTTIFRAIEYALFNQSHATTLSKIIRDGKKKAVVEFDFELGGEIYRIYRSRTTSESSDVRLSKKIGDEFVDISERTASATDIAIHDLIKISHKAFTYSVLFRQADLTGITSVEDPKKRKEILKEPLNLSKYTKLESMATKKVSPIKKEIDRLDGSISVIGNPDVDIVKADEELISTLDQIQTHRDFINASNLTIEQKRKLSEDLKESLGQEDVDIHKRVSEQEAVVKKFKENARINDKKLENISNIITIKEGALKTNKEEEDRSQEKLTELSSEPDADIDDLQEKYDKVCNDEISGSEIIAAAKAKTKYIKKTLPDGDECSTCSQSITAEYRERMTNDVNKKLKKQNEEITFLEEALVKCRNKKTKLDQLLKTARVRINDINKLETQIKTLGKEQKLLRDEIDRLYIDRNDIVKVIENEERQIKETTHSLEELKEAAEKSSALTINSKIFAINQEISRLQDEIVDYNKRITNLTSIKGGLEERITNRKADKVKLKELEISLEKNKYQLKILQYVVNSFSSSGIPNFIIQTILDDLQIEANIALKELRPELDVQIDADLNFEYRRNGVVKDYSQLSHGQHVYIALAFKRGLANVIQRRIGIKINFLIFDEVDAHLDSAGVDAFSDCVKKWQKDYVIFVITHNNDLKDKFSHAILVEEGDDGAEARVVTAW